MLDQLKHKRDVITLESASGAVALEHALNRLPDFFTTVRTTFTQFLSKPLSALFAKRDITWISKVVQNKPYTTLRTLEVYTPPGLKVDYLSYAEVLQNGGKAMLSLKTDVLAPFAAWLGQKLGNPASLASITTNLKITGYNTHSTDKLEKAIVGCFHNTGRLEVLATYGDMVKRNGDWNELARVVDTLNTMFSEVHHQEVVTLVNTCTTLMDQLMFRMQEEPETYKLSPAAVQALATTCYDIGRELEFYGLLRHRIGEFSKAVADTAGKLEQIVNN